MIKSLVLFWKRNFKVLPEQEAFELGLTHVRNVYGDEINHRNCRSIWQDVKGRQYRVRELYDFAEYGDPANMTEMQMQYISANHRFAICSNCGNSDHVTDVNINDVNMGPMCYGCCGENGHCFACGDHVAGTHEFEFSEMGHYCGHCQEEIRDSYEGSDDEFDDYDDSEENEEHF